MAPPQIAESEPCIGGPLIQISLMDPKLNSAVLEQSIRIELVDPTSLWYRQTANTKERGNLYSCYLDNHQRFTTKIVLIHIQRTELVIAYRRPANKKPTLADSSANIVMQEFEEANQGQVAPWRGLPRER